MRLHSTPTYSDRFVTTNYGATLILKACGFIQEQHAKIVDVEEDVLKLRLSAPSRWALFRMLGSERPIDIQLEMKELEKSECQGEVSERLPAAKCAQVEVKMEAGIGSWNSTDFEAYARRVMWSLRTHFMAQ